MYFDSPVQTANTLCALVACGYAAWTSGKLERLAAALIFVDWFATPLLQIHEAFSHTQAGVFALDGGLTLGLLCIALISNCYWPLWVTAFQILELLMHAAMLVDHRVRPIAYFIGMEISSYLILFALVVGTWREGSDRRRKTS